MSHQPTRLTVVERLSAVFSLSTIFAKAAASTLFKILTLRTLTSAAIRSAFMLKVAQSLHAMPIHSLRAMRPTTGQAIKASCEAASVPIETVVLSASSGFPPGTLHFVDCSSTSTGNVLLYFHGGGYIFPISPGHFEIGRRFAEASNSKLVFLEYTLAPECPYPGQLVQATAALNYLLERHGSSEIIFGGDSAGGNLTLALLAHLRQRDPDVPAVNLREGANVRAALCISPRCSSSSDAPSFERNADKDFMSVSTTKLIMQNWLPKREVWAEALRGDEEFWKIIHADKILLIGGEDESYIDDIREFARLIGAKEGADASQTRQLVTCKGENHVQSMTDLSVGIESESLRAIVKWLKTV